MGYLHLKQEYRPVSKKIQIHGFVPENMQGVARKKSGKTPEI